MPHASETERRAATDRQLHETVTAKASAKASEWKQYRAQRAEAKAARAEATAAQTDNEVPVVLPAPRPAAFVVAPVAEPQFGDVDDDQELVLENLTREQVLDWRNRAAADHRLVFDHIDRYGERSAQRLFTRAFVARVQRLSGLEHLELGCTTWVHA